MTGPMVTTCPVVDALVNGDGAVVLTDSTRGHQVLRVSPLAQAVREIAEGGVPLSNLAAELILRFGPPADDVSSAVLTLVEQLSSVGLVSIDW